MVRKQDYKDLVTKLENEEKEREAEERRQKEEHLKKLKATIERLKCLHYKCQLLTPESRETLRMSQERKKVGS